MKGALGLAAGLACAAVIACSARQKSATMPAPPTATESPAAAGAHGAEPVPSDPHAAIEYYAEQIESQRKQMQLPEVVLPMSATPSAPNPPSAALPPHAAEDTTCHAAASSTCGDVCRMSDQICDNSGKICKIADDLGNDEWAVGKCTSARQTCGDAHKRCCECT